MTKLFISLVLFTSIYSSQLFGIPLHVRELNGKTAIWDNARCFNALMWRLGLTSVPFGAGGRSLRALIASDLVIKKSWDTKTAGDFVIIETNGEMEHVFFLEENDTIFHKAGSPSEFPYEIIPLDRLLFEIPYTQTYGQVYRLKQGAKQTISYAKRGLPRSITMHEKKLIEVEQQLIKYVIVDPSRTEYSNKHYKEFQEADDHARDLAHKFYKQVNPLIEKLNPTLSQKFYLELLDESYEAIGSISGPND